MDQGVPAAAERLAAEFEDLPNSTVIRALADCAEEFPHEDAAFVERAVRARLSLARKVVHQLEYDEHEAVGLSLHDRDRAEEVELTALLIVAANESSARLRQDEIDRVLGTAPGP